MRYFSIWAASAQKNPTIKLKKMTKCFSLMWFSRQRRNFMNVSSSFINSSFILIFHLSKNEMRIYNKKCSAKVSFRFFFVLFSIVPLSVTIFLWKDYRMNVDCAMLFLMCWEWMRCVVLWALFTLLRMCRLEKNIN